MITSENKKWIAEKVDEAIKASGLLELVDGLLAKVALNLIDDFVENKLKPSPEIVEKINGLVEAAKEGDIEEVEEISGEIINSLVDIPGIDEEGEVILFDAAIKLIVGAVKTFLAKQSA